MTRTDSDPFFGTPAYYEHLKLVCLDPEFKESIQKLGFEIKGKRTSADFLPIYKRQRKAAEAIGTRFRLKYTDVIFIARKKIAPTQNHNHPIFFRYTEEYIYIRMPRDVKKERVYSIWKSIKHDRELEAILKDRILPSKRYRTPENTKLLYAIFKSRPQMTFKEIYTLYQNGELPNYTGSRSIKSEDKLEEFYRKYYPSV